MTKLALLISCLALMIILVPLLIIYTIDYYLNLKDKLVKRKKEKEVIISIPCANTVTDKQHVSNKDTSSKVPHGVRFYVLKGEYIGEDELLKLTKEQLKEKYPNEPWLPSLIDRVKHRY